MLKKQLGRREKRWLVLLGCLLVVFLLYQSYLKPRYERFLALNHSYHTLDKQLLALPDLEPQLASAQQSLSTLETSIAALKNDPTFPLNTPNLLLVTGNVAQRLHLAVLDFEPLPVEDKTSHWEAPYRVALKGEYSDLVSFLGSLSNFGYYVDYDNLKLTSNLEKDVVLQVVTNTAEVGTSDLSQVNMQNLSLTPTGGQPVQEVTQLIHTNSPVTLSFDVRFMLFQAPTNTNQTINSLPVAVGSNNPFTSGNGLAGALPQVQTSYPDTYYGDDFADDAQVAALLNRAKVDSTFLQQEIERARAATKNRERDGQNSVHQRLYLNQLLALVLEGLT